MIDKENLGSIYSPQIPSNRDIEKHIPILGYANPHTLLCKNGEIIQIIKIDPLEFNELLDYRNIRDLRKELRSAILDIFQDLRFAIYIHTVRNRRDITPKGIEPVGFANDLNHKWNKKNNWDKQLFNTIYISIIYQSDAYSVSKNPFFFTIALLYPLLKARFNKDLLAAEKHLEEKVSELLERLRKFGARSLTLKRVPEGYVSEHLEFYHQILHLNKKVTFVPLRSFATYLSHTKIKFKFNTANIAPGTIEHRFAALFTMKNLNEINIDTLDDLLHIGSEFVISQFIRAVPTSEAKNGYKLIKAAVDYGNDEVVKDVSGLAEFYSADEGYVNDYSSIISTICVYADSEAFFQNKINAVLKIFAKIGIIAVREDFYLPKLFWFQLPGNIRYIVPRRTQYLNTSRVGHFVSIFNKMSGNYVGSSWGDAITLIRSVFGTPFYLNFHNLSNNGNTIVVGPTGGGKTVLTRFLLSQALKFSNNIISIDIFGRNKGFMELIGGKSFKVSNLIDSDFLINPFNLANFNDNIENYRIWLHNAIYPKTLHLPQFIEYFKILTTYLLEAGPEISKLALLKAAVEDSHDSFMKEGFAAFVDSPAFNKIFKETDDSKDLQFLQTHHLMNIDLSDLTQSPVILESYLGIILNRIGQSVGNRPTIIMIDDFARVLPIQSFAENLTSWLASLRAKNCIAICSTTRNDDQDKAPLFQKILKEFGTKMILSDKFANKHFRRNYSLLDSELNGVKSYETKRRIFLFKQEEVSIFLQLSLDGLDDELKILCMTGAG